MIRIELTPEQAATLREMLEGWLGDLRMEVSKTDQKDFRDRLKEREELLKSIIGRLPAPAAGQSDASSAGSSGAPSTS